jgi:5-methyltetrahydropteroyltriglutamate--homocysteine methyltransferase
LSAIKQNLKPGQLIFLRTDVLNPRVETAEEIRDTILEAAETIPVDQLGLLTTVAFLPLLTMFQLPGILPLLK